MTHRRQRQTPAPAPRDERGARLRRLDIELAIISLMRVPDDGRSEVNITITRTDDESLAGQSS